MAVSEDLQLHEYCFHFAHLTAGSSGARIGTKVMSERSGAENTCTSIPPRS